MKTIFRETKRIAEWDFPRVRTAKRVGQSYDWEGYIEKCAPYVFRSNPESVKASVTAKWDKATGVLFVECRAWCGETDVDWLPALPQETLERIHVRETMLRRVIEIADDWYAMVACAIPHNPTDAELLAAVSDQLTAEPIEEPVLF